MVACDSSDARFPDALTFVVGYPHAAAVRVLICVNRPRMNEPLTISQVPSEFIGRNWEAGTTLHNGIRDDSDAELESRSVAAAPLDRCYHRWLVDLSVPEEQTGSLLYRLRMYSG